jgi:CheY-like chemotaxis protein
MAGILIIDDDPSIRTMFARALQALGEIEVAANGAEALRLLGSKRYGVILLDLHMPVIDGFVLLQTLGTRPGPNHDVPVYVITADTSDQARIRALRRHAVFFLSKPVPIATLTALVDATLKKGAARAALAEGERGADEPSATDGAPGASRRTTPPVRPSFVTPKKPG